MKPVLLAILDGFGLREETKGNAVKLASKPTFDFLWNTYPHSTLEASGEEVGLPKGQMGNSEVGHLNIGGGRIVYQPLELISKEIREGNFFSNKELLSVMNHVKINNSKLHIFGLLSDGGIHSHINHIIALLEMAKKQNVERVYFHAFLDGRDTLPDVACNYLDQLQEKINEYNLGSIADISGRYYSMDRERMWNLTEKYYRLLVDKVAKVISDYSSYIKEQYENKIYDEFIEPAILDTNGNLEENDGLIFANFRPDRATQTFTAITNPNFKEFETTKFENIKLVTMMPVEKTIICTNAYDHVTVPNSLGTYLSKNKKRVLRIAEASKYPHITYFFDGGEELELEGTDKIIVPRKSVATYDMAPEMSAYEIGDKLGEIMGDYDVIILNFANCDMVGHTGNLEAAIKAVEAVDENLGRIYAKIQELGGLLIVTADHGNCELMIDEEDNVITSHTTNKVPFIICHPDYEPQNGKLGDIAPTILKIMQMEKPEEMTGTSLI
ncbi:MAG: 2,3-bisphosphoglycerate-independent phosphoglycerate mutase [Firmicutes bacterium]|nr:2,3-bisphosphoglycerate-independent phosphoglycerate mutase [Bacillota bacterium]